MFALLKKLFELLVKIQAEIGRFFTSLPFWSDVEKMAMIVAGPVRKIAALALRCFPFLRRFEKYLETEALTKRPPVLLAISILFIVYRGLMKSPNGHIGTDTAVFPFLTLVSCFNPFLGMISGVCFGAADLLQKLVRPDIYGAKHFGDPNYYGALAGYIVAYSVTIWMGLFPGLLSRIGRNIAIGIFQKIRGSRAAAHADGATPPIEDSLTEAAGLLGSIVGGVLGGFTGVRFVAPALEKPAFYWRPEPDVSCYESEVETLVQTAPTSAGAGAIGGAIGATAPPGTPHQQPPKLPPSPGNATGDDGEPVSPTDDDLPPSGEEGGWEVSYDGKIYTFPTEEDASEFCDNLGKKESINQAENDYKNAVEQLGFLESVRNGLKSSGRDTAQQDREIERWKRQRDDYRKQVNQLGGSTDYTARQRSDWRFGEHDELIKEQKRKSDLMRDIHKAAKGTRNLANKDIISYTDGQTENILKKLNTWSDQLVSGEGEQPTREQLEQLRNILRKEMGAEQARVDARNTNWVKEGAQGTSREIFTGVNPDGETSYKAMVLRAALGAATGGQSEGVMEVAEKMYIVNDEVMKGKSGMDAFKTAATRVLGDELTGLMVEKGITGVAKGASKVGGAGYEAFVKGSNVDEMLTSGSKKVKSGATRVKNFLDQDVGDVLKGGSKKMGESGGRVVSRPKTDLDLDTPKTKTDIEPAKAPDLDESALKRKESFETGRKGGKEKVDKLKEAFENRKNNPDSPQAKQDFQDAVDSVQQDKHAMQQMNPKNGVDPTSVEIREGFNKELNTSYEKAHQTTRQRIADEYGVPIEKVKVVKPTNTPSGGTIEAADPRGFAKKPDPNFKTDPNDYVQPKSVEVDVNGKKVSFDQDVTCRVEQDNIIDPRTGKVSSGHVDVPKADTERIYNEEFYKARHDGELPTKVDANTGKVEIDQKKVKDYAEDMDQACTDRLDKEAYGNGDADLQTAVKGDYKGRDFDDVEGVAKTMEHKQYEWEGKAKNCTDEAEKLRTKANDLKASGKIEDAQQLNRRADDLEVKAEGLKEEGYRQTTKQHGNQLEARVDAVNQQEIYKHHNGELPTKTNPNTGKVEVDMKKVSQHQQDLYKQNNGELPTVTKADGSVEVDMKKVSEVNTQQAKAAGVRTAEVSPKLNEAIDIMKKTGEPGFSPVEVEARLRKIGYTPAKVSQQMSSNLESLQKFRGSSDSGIPDVTAGGAEFDYKAAGKSLLAKFKKPIGKKIFGSDSD